MSQFTRELARQILLSNSFVDTMTDIFALEIERQLQGLAGGDTIYIPKTSAHHDKTQRNLIIRAKFNGHNLPELVKTFGLTARQLRRIVRSK